MSVQLGDTTAMQLVVSAVMWLEVGTVSSAAVCLDSLETVWTRVRTSTSVLWVWILVTPPAHTASTLTEALLAPAMTGLLLMQWARVLVSLSTCVIAPVYDTLFYLYL